MSKYASSRTYGHDCDDAGDCDHQIVNSDAVRCFADMNEDEANDLHVVRITLRVSYYSSTRGHDGVARRQCSMLHVPHAIKALSTRTSNTKSNPLTGTVQYDVLKRSSGIGNR